MKNVSVADLLELPVAERIQLVELIWDSITAIPEAVPLTEELKAELDHRFAEFESNPESRSPWEEVRDRIARGTLGTGLKAV